MQSSSRTAERQPVYAFRLTPAEWRQLLADGSFLSDPDNSIRPRRLMGVPVQIIPDHRFAAAGQSASGQSASGAW